jgi:hypothetical protein
MLLRNDLLTLTRTLNKGYTITKHYETNKWELVLIDVSKHLFSGWKVIACQDDKKVSFTQKNCFQFSVFLVASK